MLVVRRTTSIIMTSLKAAFSNLRILVGYTDLTALKLSVALGSLLWMVWAIIAAWADNYYIQVTAPYQLMFDTAPLWVWGTAFAIHGFGSLYTTLLHLHGKWSSIGWSGFGALIWTFNADLILVARLHEHSLPLGGAHWLVAILAWWIFLRQCINPND